MTLSKSRSSLLAATVCVGLLAGFSAPSSADEKDDIRREQAKVDQELKDAQNEVVESSKALQKASTALNAANAKLAAAQAVLDTTRGKLAAAKAEDERLRRELLAAQKRLADAEARVAAAEKKLEESTGEVEAFAVESLMQGDPGLRAFGGLLEGEDPNRFSEKMSATTSISDAQIARMQELAASRVMLEVEREKVEKLRDAVARQKEAAAHNVVVMKDLTAAAEAQTAEVATLVGSREAIRKSAASALAEDERVAAERAAEQASLARQLEKVIQDELEAERRRKEKEKKGGGGGSNDTSDPPTGDGGGALSYPVSGPITSPYGMRRHPITGVYKLHDGTDFGVGCGTPIRAAAGGRIVSQYYNGAYGNRVILNNGVKRGVSVVTTYNHLSRFAKSAGTKVSRGEVIGYVGSTGYSTGCHLHFMVLVNGTTTNPMNWL